ncbi:MAG TPA: tail protein X [Lamprocystis sp. (in: g-proteobacteria)]|nr:tail protein X [Lamprocystis sp. (in: g-proteobacteria)]
MTTYRTRDDDVLDDLCWRHYGTQSGPVEVVLDANPGLADLGPIYPAGVLIILPDLPAQTAPVASPPVRLWD